MSRARRARRAAACVAPLACALAGGAAAQPFERPAQERPPLPRFEEPGAARPELALPPLPPPEPGLAAGPRFLVRGFAIEGSSVFSHEELQAAVAPWAGRELGSEDLVAVRDALTRLYVEHGYVNSGARIPDQDLEGGVVRVEIVEGRLAAIELAGVRHYRPETLRRRLALAASVPLEVGRLEEALQLLQQDPRIARVNARLRPGERPGEAVLDVSVEESRPWRLALEANNWETPAFGGTQGELEAGHANLLGFGDELSSHVRVAEGLVETEGAYDLPVGARGTLLRFGGEWSRSKIVESPFDELDVRTYYQSARIGVQQALYRTPNTDLRVELLGEWRHAKTELCVFEDLLGGCDSFAFPGSGANPDDGKTTVSVLRFSQELVRRDLDQVIAARSMLSVGLGILGATDQDLSPSQLGVSDLRNPDGQFVAWLAQLQWARRFGPWDVEAIARLDAQVVSDALPSLERFPVGGHLSVRGYRENQIVRDQGVVTSLELRIPLRLFEERFGRLALAPFADFGHATNRRNPTPDPENLGSVGIGLRWALGPAEAQLYWGHPLVGVDDSGDLQDDGVQFRVGVRIF